jgi:hypothetical protein
MRVTVVRERNQREQILKVVDIMRGSTGEMKAKVEVKGAQYARVSRGPSTSVVGEECRKGLRKGREGEPGVLPSPNLAVMRWR